MDDQDLEQLAAELRAEIVHTVSKTGGHLSSSLGVVELTVALHHVFDAPDDKIIWDVGHQVTYSKPVRSITLVIAPNAPELVFLIGLQLTYSKRTTF